MRGLRASMILGVAAALLGAAPVATPLPGVQKDAVEAFFARPELGETRALIVLQDGAPVVERYGPGKYLVAIGAKLVDADGGIGVDGSAPRALYEDDKRQKWMVGTDGSTGRVYYMSVPNETKTCREGHQLISGLADETKCQFEC